MSLLKVLQTGDDILIELHGNFLRMRRQVADSSHLINIFSFMETLPQKRRLVVSPSSARLDEDTDVSVMKNHSDLTKFRSSVTRMSDSSFDIFIHFMEESYSCIRVREFQVDQSSARLEDEQVQLPFRPSMTRIGLRMECLESFSFPELGSKMAMVDSHEPETCQWVYNESSFRKWNSAFQPLAQEPHHRTLILRGMPGSGKSTLIKFLYQDAKERIGETRQLRIVFFFNATGAYLERSPTGLYMSILAQLLEYSPKTIDLISPSYVRKKASKPGEKVTWRSWELRDLVFSILTNRTFINERVTFYLDALDECSETEGQQVANDIDKLVALARSNGIQVSVCMSTRNYPHISLRHCLEVQLETQNTSDIELVTRQALFDPDLEPFSETIVGKAAGNFLWARIVISRLQEFANQGQTSPTFIETFLHDIPEELKAMFVRIILSMNPKQRSLTSIMLQWIISACRPLTIRELVYATALTATSQALSLHDFLNFSGVRHSDESSLEKFVSFTTCGILRKWDDLRQSECTIGFVHQTLRDFVLSEGLHLLGFKTVEAFETISRDTIAQSIYRLSVQPAIASDIQRALESYLASSSCTNMIPLAEYLICYCFDHFAATPSNKPWRPEILNGPILHFWLLLNCLVTDCFEFHRQYDHSHWRRTHRGFESGCSVGITAFPLSGDLTDLTDLMSCLNNRNLFLRDLALDRTRDPRIRLARGQTYHQCFWPARGFNEANQMIGVLTGGRLYPGIATTEAMQVCERYASGLAFVARFTFDVGSTGPLQHLNAVNLPYQNQQDYSVAGLGLTHWSVSVNPEQWRKWGLPNSDYNLSPLHRKVEGVGYISLLLQSPAYYGGDWETISIRYCEDGNAYRSPILSPHTKSPVSSIASLRAEIGTPVEIVLPLHDNLETGKRKRPDNAKEYPKTRLCRNNIADGIEVNDDAISWTSRCSSQSNLYRPESTSARSLRDADSIDGSSTKDQVLESWVSQLEDEGS